MLSLAWIVQKHTVWKTISWKAKKDPITQENPLQRRLDAKGEQTERARTRGRYFFEIFRH